MTVTARFTEIGADSLARMELTHEKTEEGGDERELLDTLLALRTRKGLVYTTVVFDGGIEFVLTTTSKDIQLGIASMPESARAAFCRIVDEELDAIGRPGLIFLPPMGGEHEIQRAMHIMRTDDTVKEGRVFLVLSRTP